MIYNFNDTVTVTLMSDGLDLLRRAYAGVVQCDVDIPGFDTQTLVYSTQLWSLMETFGPNMSIGKNRLFVGNEIEIVVVEHKTVIKTGE